MVFPAKKGDQHRNPRKQLTESFFVLAVRGSVRKLSAHKRTCGESERRCRDPNHSVGSLTAQISPAGRLLLRMELYLVSLRSTSFMGDNASDRGSAETTISSESALRGSRPLFEHELRIYLVTPWHADRTFRVQNWNGDRLDQRCSLPAIPMFPMSSSTGDTPSDEPARRPALTPASGHASPPTTGANPV